jgi:hypothetical protein
MSAKLLLVVGLIATLLLGAGCDPADEASCPDGRVVAQHDHPRASACDQPTPALRLLPPSAAHQLRDRAAPSAQHPLDTAPQRR